MHLHALDYALWVAAPCLQGGVLFFMRRRGLAAQLPIFFAYTIFQAATDVLLLVVEPYSYRAYFYSYWSVTALTVLFTFALIDELFRAAFRNFAAIRNIGASVFRWGALLVLVAAVLTAFSFGALARVSDFDAAVLRADRVARAMLSLLAVLLLMGARFLRIPRRSALYGIALGFFAYMAAKVLLDSLALLHITTSRVVTRLNSMAYLSSCVLWLMYAALGDKLPEASKSSESEEDAGGDKNLIDVINRIVEESMRKAEKPT